jgi:hypothetical protein
MAIRKDILKEFTSLQQELGDERRRIQSRLAQLDRVLSLTVAATAGVPNVPSPQNGNQAPRRERVQNKLSMREAIEEATAQRPLAVRDIVDAVQRLGFRFRSTNPVNSIGAYLYGKEGKKFFAKKPEGFASIGRAGSAKGKSGTRKK